LGAPTEAPLARTNLLIPADLNFTVTTKLPALVHTVFPAMLLTLLAGGIGFLASQDKEIIGLIAILAAVGVVIIFARPEFGILLFLASFLITYGKLIPTEGRFTPNNLLGLFFAVMLLLKIYQEKNVAFLKEPLIRIFLVMVIFFHLSSRILEPQLGNPFPELDLTAVMLHELTSRFLFLVFFINFIRTLRDVKLVVWMTLCLILTTAISGAVNSFSGAEFDMGGRAAANLGIGSAANANRLGFFCVFGIALAWSCKEIVHSRALKIVLTAAVPGLAFAALLTASRSGLLNLFVVFGLFAMEGRFSIKRQLHLILIAGVAIFLATELLSETHLERLQNVLPGSSTAVKGTASTEERLNNLTDVFKVITQNPMLGIGIGNFRWVRLEDFGNATPPHNSYLLAASEGGVPMLGLYLLLFGLTVKYFVDAERKSNSSEVRSIARGLRIGLLTFLFFTLFADFWSDIVTYLLVGLAIVLRRLQAEESASKVVLRPNYQPVPASI
jgi:O-antigen ligase